MALAAATSGSEAAPMPKAAPWLATSRSRSRPPATVIWRPAPSAAKAQALVAASAARPTSAVPAGSKTVRVMRPSMPVLAAR